MGVFVSTKGAPESIRRGVGVSRAAAARLAGCSLPTVRVYEIDPARVGPVKRPALDRIYSVFATLANAAAEVRAR